MCKHVLSAEMDEIDKGIILEISKIQHQLERQNNQQQELKGNIQNTFEEVLNPIPMHKRRMYIVFILQRKTDASNSNKIQIVFIKGMCSSLKRKT